MSAKVLAALKAAHASAIEALEDQHGDAIAWIKRDHLLAVATWLKTDPAMAFDAPVFATCIDRVDWQPVDVPPGLPVYPATAGWTEDKPRFEVVWQLRSQLHRHRLRLKCAVAEHDPRVPSLVTGGLGTNNRTPMVQQQLYNCLVASN